MAPWYVKDGDLGRHGQEAQDGTAEGCDGKWVTRGWVGLERITPVAATGLWKAPSSPRGELVTPGISQMVLWEGAVNQTHSRSKDTVTGRGDMASSLQPVTVTSRIHILRARYQGVEGKARVDLNFTVRTLCSRR